MALISAKIIMAFSGLFLIVFLIFHLLGNLLIFQGPEVFNAYPELLRAYPKLLWTARIGLIATFVAHIFTSIYLSIKNKAARPVSYHGKKSIKASLASRTMLLAGLVILGFLLAHLAHFTWRLFYPEYAHLDLYSLVVLSFQDIFVAGFYILAQVFLGMHLSHGFFSAAQTLSLTRCHAVCFLNIGYVFAIVLTVSFISIPVSCLMGWLHV